MPNDQVHAVISEGLTGSKFSNRLLLGLGEVCKVTYRIGRVFRLYGKKNNVYPLACGHLLDATVGHRPEVQRIARFIFGSLACLQCIQSLKKIKALSKQCALQFAGKHYVIMKKDEIYSNTASSLLSPSSKDRLRWFRKMYLPHQFKQAFITIGQIFKEFFNLGMSLGDAHAAWNQRNVSEIFVHGRDLYNVLAQDPLELSYAINKARLITDKALGRMGSGFTSKLLLSALTLPEKIQRTKEEVQEKGQDFATRIDAVWEVVKNYLKGTSKENNRYNIYEKKSLSDPNVHRFIESPNWVGKEGG